MELPYPQKKALELTARVLPPYRPGYLVGGFVRDTFLGRESADVDLAMPGEPSVALDMARRLANASRRELSSYRASPFSLDPNFGVARVVFTPIENPDENKAFYFDFAVLNGGTIENDLARRDFTINALALPLASFLTAGQMLRLEDAIETPGGKADLIARIIRPVGEQNLIDDPLRMLRGIRLRAQLSGKANTWEFAPGTLELFKKLSLLITRSAAERVRDELNKTWLAGDAAASFQLLYESGLLLALLPEFGQENVPLIFERTLRLLHRLEWLVTLPAAFYGEAEAETPHPQEVIRYWPEILARLQTRNGEKLALLYWASLLYHIRHSFSSDMTEQAQEETPGEMRPARQIMSRLRFSREATEHTSIMLRQQAALNELSQRFDPATQSDLSNREIYRFLRDCGPVHIEVLLLWLAEQDGVAWAKNLALIDFLSRKAIGSEEERLIDKPRLVDGSQLIKLVQVKPGPKVGLILRELEEAQADGQIKTTEEALELARRLNNN